MGYLFHIGQEIIAVRTHSKNIFRKGDILIVRNIKSACCHCFQFSVDIGHTHTVHEMHCSKCDLVFTNEDGVYWFANTNFAPLDSAEKLLRNSAFETIAV